MDELIPPDRLPPHSKAAEDAILGAMLRDPDCCADVADVVQAGDFYYAHNLSVFDAVMGMRAAGHPIDLVTVCERLKATRRDHESWHTCLAELWDQVPTSANAAYHAKLVRNHAVRRRLIHSSTEILRDAYDGAGDAEELALTAARRIAEAGDRFSSPSVRTLNEVLAETVASLDRRATAKVAETGRPTGIEDLDVLTAGLHDCELVTLAARPGVGKSALALRVAMSVARAGHAVLFVSLEMGGGEQVQRLLVSEAGVHNERVRRGRYSAEEAGRIATASQVLFGHPFWIDDAPHQTVIRIAATASRIHRKHKLGLVVIDYLQLIRPTNTRVPRHEQVAEMSRELKLLAKQLQAPVLLLAQLNRDSERENRRPRVSDLRESGAVEQDSDTIMLLHQEGEGTDGTQNIELIVGKQRNGPKGSIRLRYEGRFFRFSQYDPEYDPER
jgi:replicative DNA helicase